MINLHLGDSLEAMRQMPDKAFSLAIVDPPYGIGEDGRNNHTRSKLTKSTNYKSNARYDDASPSVEFFNELLRVSRNQIIWGANHFISKVPFDSSAWIVWDKNNGENDFADCELAWSSFPSAVRKFKWTWQGMLQEDMKNKQKRIHPNEKPIPLYKWLLKNYAKPGDKILDTHLGSGSIAIACHDLGFDLEGYEIDPEYYASATKRLETHQRQLTMFTPNALAFP